MYESLKEFDLEGKINELNEIYTNDYDSGADLRHLISIEQPQYSKEAAILWTLRQVTKKRRKCRLKIH
jgi:hypothetical protein